MKRTILISFPIILLLGIYFLGPEPARPVWNSSMPTVPTESSELEKYIATAESRHRIKPDNEARIVWADSSRRKTPWSIVYLHGFSASQGEGIPIHTDIAREFGCNLFLARLSDHGIDTAEQLLNFTPDRFWASSKEAMAIGKAIGDRVIIMSTSTGGTMALLLASKYPTEVSALINLSPNVKLFDPLSSVANDPWGVQIARLVFHGKYNVSKPRPGRDQAIVDRYWNDKYRLEAVSQLEEMLEDAMTPETFHRVTQPSLSLYYYKDQAHQDSTVSVPAIIKMNEELGTTDSLKVAVALPDANDHVIGSKYRSGDLEGVRREIEKFMTSKLHLTPVH